MVVQTNYVLKCNTTNSTMFTFRFKTLLEVKNFVNKVYDLGGLATGTYSIKLYKETVEWDLSTGAFDSGLTPITTDF